ncbi:hypothetical protein EV188_11395 [Actinomycetospora succinea]|uniref:Uncharacterized protein n=1 Tax=Actinomycetospora succinea TaxID=663603 RepID=A0A4R6UK55_9PSEU|nr:hypothetical protein [Actinomycetospora succinea]TDQ47350.1 hypothetical protein EV188_11395 [Actinomycetospora succinea]
MPQADRSPTPRPARPLDRLLTDPFTREPAVTTIRTTPARVRTDAPRTDVDRPSAPVASAVPSTRSLRLLGAGLAAGATAYGAAFIGLGITRGEAATDGSFASDLCGLLFQLGVFCLLAAMWRTGAAGTSRLARTMIIVEAVILAVATVQSALTLPSMGGEWSTAAVVLDPFWPLSMLGMAVLGVKVAVAGRWRGVLRAWPVVAETWFFVAMPALLVLGPALGAVVAGAHFLVGYAVLGLLLVTRPDLAVRA